MDTVAMTEQAGIGQSRAGFASRGIAFILDLLIVSVILLGAGFFLQLIGSYFPLGKLFAHVAGLDVGGGLRTPVALALSIIAFVAYNTFWWAMIGETPGKAALGLRVVRTNGQRLTVLRSIVRSLAYWLSALPLFLGFLWILVSDKRQGWHDKIADTCVIYAWQAHPAPRAARTSRRAARAS